MQQFSAPMVAPIDEVRNVPQLVRARAERAPEAIAFSVHRGSSVEQVTTRQFVDEVEAVAKGLIAQGLQPGQRVAIMSATRYEWALIDYAIMFAGGITVPIYETSSAAQTRFILSDSGAVMVFVENARHAKVVAEARDGGLPELQHVWRLHGNSDLDQVKQAGEGVEDALLDERAMLAGPDDVASLVYTSGTTSDPRGAEVTHANLAQLTVNVVVMMKDILFDGASTVILLPLAHILARFVQTACFHIGVRITHLRDASRITQVLSDAEPTFMVVVPRVLAKLHEAVRKKAEAKNMGKVFAAAEQTAIAWSQQSEEIREGRRKSHSLTLRAKHALFDKLFYAKIRTTLGGQLGTIISGAAPLDPKLGHFFTGAGVEIIEGYGLTETTAPITINIPGRPCIGKVGEVTPGSTIKIGPEGEVLVKGLGVFKGYFNDNAKDFDADGFFNTGDLGELDARGRLSITGRAKDLVITDSGKNISPAKWQGIVERSPLVGHAVVVGDKRPFAAALVLLDAAGLKEWAEKNGKPDLAAKAEAPRRAPGELITDADVLAEVERAINEANAQVSHAEHIQHHRVVLTEVTEDSGLLTPTMKLKRGVLLQQMSTVVDAIYR